MVVAAFLVIDKANWVRFFEKTFLMANVCLKVVFKMFFLTLSSANVDFLGWELRWRIYITKKILPTTKCVKLVGKGEFAALLLNPEYETFIVNVA